MGQGTNDLESKIVREQTGKGTTGSGSKKLGDSFLLFSRNRQ